MSLKTGQVFLITVFTLTFSLLILFFLLTPLRDKIIRIKEMDYIYQALANSEKGIEATLLKIFKNEDLNLNENQEIHGLTTECGGMSYNNKSGTCLKTIYEPNIGSRWTENDEFKTENFIFFVQDNNEIIVKVKTFSDGFMKKFIRSIVMESK